MTGKNRNRMATCASRILVRPTAIGRLVLRLLLLSMSWRPAASAVRHGYICVGRTDEAKECKRSSVIEKTV